MFLTGRLWGRPLEMHESAISCTLQTRVTHKSCAYQHLALARRSTASKHAAQRKVQNMRYVSCATSVTGCAQGMEGLLSQSGWSRSWQVRMCMPVSHMFAYAGVCVCVCAGVCAGVCTCVFMCLRTYMWVRMCVTRTCIPAIHPWPEPAHPSLRRQQPPNSR